MEREAERMTEYHRRMERGRRHRRSDYENDAREFLARDVSEFLADPNSRLGPDDMFADSRRPHAWAAAERLREVFAADPRMVTIHEPLCDCGHPRSFHTASRGENAVSFGRCRGFGRDLDPAYRIPPDEPCACEEFTQS